MTKRKDQARSLEEVWAERHSFLGIGVTPRLGTGDDPEAGWDVVLRLDGSYEDRETAQEVAEAMAEELRAGGLRLEWEPEDVQVVDGVVKPRRRTRERGS